MQTISRNLQAQGYQVTFITGEGFREQVEQTGAKCVVPPGWANFNDEYAQNFVSQQSGLSFIEKENLITTELFIKPISVQFESIQAILASSTVEHPKKPVVLLTESSFLGGLPFQLGAPGLQPKGVIAVGILPILAVSIDTGPPEHGLLPDSSKEGQQRNKSLNKAFVDALESSQSELNRILEGLGARTINVYRHNAVIELSNVFLQLCPPSLEYPRSDAPPTLRFTGGLPLSDTKSIEVQALPIWWNDLLLSKGKHQIVAVSQGTVIRNYNDLIIPTLEALGGSNDLLVVVALGKHGATLPTTAFIPENARVADWIPFDQLLSVSDIFVTNGGYGSFQNALARAVPLVIAAPRFADKTDIADRVEWSGTGINLKTGTPSPEAVKKAVVTVLTTQRYKRRALEIQAEIETYHPMAIITAAVDEVAGL